MATLKPWYQYPRIDNFGSIDPQRGANNSTYWKPDSNVLTPPGYPVTALLPGTVTSVSRTSWGQSVVTIKLDKALNRLANHIFYEHMHDSSVRSGQHVNSGDLIGHANLQGEGAALGFGLYSGDVYGSGQAWSILQNDLKPGGAGLLNPVALLNSAASGQLLVGSGGGAIPYGSVFGLGGGQASDSSGSSSSGPTFIPLISQVHETLINTPGFYGISLALDEAEEFPGWIDLTQPVEWNIAGGQIDFPDFVGTVRSVGATFGDNFLPFTIRSSIAMIGVILVVALLLKVVSGPVSGAARILPALMA